MENDIEKAIKQLVICSLISEKPKEAIAEKLGVKNINDLIQFIAKEEQISTEEAKRKIAESPTLLGIAFILA